MKGPAKRIEVLLVLFVARAYSQQYLSTSIAGGGLPPTAAPALTMPIFVASGIFYSDGAGDGGSPTAVAWSTSGLYFAADNCIFKLDRAGLVTRIAGASLLAGYAGDGGQATRGYFNQPQSLALDSNGNLFVADSGNHVIRKISPDGIITTVAGTGVPGRSGDGGPATQAALSYPRAVAVDGSGNLYIADTGNYGLRKVTPNQVISTVIYQEDLTHLLPRVPVSYGLAVDSGGDLLFTDYQNSAVHKIGTGGILTTIAGNGRPGYSGDGGPATNAQLNLPTSIAVAADGTIYVADSGNHAVRKIAKDGTITTVAGTGA